MLPLTILLSSIWTSPATPIPNNSSNISEPRIPPTDPTAPVPELNSPIESGNNASDLDEDMIARQDPPLVWEDVEIPDPSETPKNTASASHSHRHVAEEMHFGLSIPSLVVSVSVVSVVSFLVIYFYRRPAPSGWIQSEAPLLAMEDG
jgi:hypothetical protein